MDAPVNAPFLCPKRRASSIFSGIAAQLIATKGFSQRGELLWIYWASTSLPLPVGPLINTFTLDFETFRARVSNSIEVLSAAIVLSPWVMKLTIRFNKNDFSRLSFTDGIAMRSMAPFIERSTFNSSAPSSIITIDLALLFFAISTTLFRPPTFFSKAALNIAFTCSAGLSILSLGSACSTVLHW